MQELGPYSNICTTWSPGNLHGRLGHSGFRGCSSLRRALWRTLSAALTIFEVPNAVTMQPATCCTTIYSFWCKGGVAAALSPCQFW